VIVDETVRTVRVIASGGTIAMAGRHAVPTLDADQLVGEISALTGIEVRTDNPMSLPGSHLSLGDALSLAQLAIAAAESGEGVVVTQGTDTLEEVAFLCDLLYGGQMPIVFTGAMRPATSLGSDGPANILDAVTVASSAKADGLGVLVSFAGRIHAARSIRKTDSVGLVAFSSPHGEVGRVVEGRVAIEQKPPRRPAITPESLDHRAEIVSAGLGSDGGMIQTLLADGLDGLIAVALGAGHFPPRFLQQLSIAAERVPVIATVRPERGAILHDTYGFAGSERDLRRTPIVPAGLLSPAAARIKLLACLGAGLSGAEIREAFAVDDG
jgi:L-asparaginase